MKRLLMLAVLFGLVGCTNLADLRGRTPDKTLTSTKPVEVVSQCILLNWQTLRDILSVPINTYIQPAPGGMVIYTESYTAGADVMKNGDHTKVKLFLRVPYHRDDYRELAEKCI